MPPQYRPLPSSSLRLSLGYMQQACDSTPVAHPSGAADSVHTHSSDSTCHSGRQRIRARASR
jgi:hypothetical protein